MIAIAALAVLALAGCERQQDRVAFEGQMFRAKAAKIGDDRAAFTVAVSPVTASVDGARQAGQYEATKYCIKNYGSSRIDWVAGPEAESLTLDGDTALFQGRCTP
jgi:hypothetical protein